MGIEAVKLAKYLQPTVRHKCLWRTHRKSASQICLLMNSRLCLIRERKEPVSVLKCAAANIRQNDIPGYTIEERSTQFTFQSLNMGRDIRLGVAKFSSGAREAVRRGNHLESLDLQQVEHSNSLSRSFSFKHRLQER